MIRASWLVGVEVAAIAVVLTVALDMRAHARVETQGGVNVWGYRGPVAHQRQPNEIRVVVVGGTRAFGWGLPASALVAEIRRVIMLTTDRRGAALRPVVVINLGRMGALPASYPETIEHYSYLRPDFICLYDDLGVSGGSATSGTGGTSAVFELTGYAPALPLALREKGLVWRFGEVRSGYVPVGLRPGGGISLVRSAAGLLIQTVGDTLDTADRLAARILARHRDLPDRRTGTDVDAAAYSEAMMKAIATAHAAARGVVVVLSPPETGQQAANRRALDGDLAPAAGAEPWLRVVDLGIDARLAADVTLRIDDWNYASAGVALVANRIAPALVSLISPS
jgi:hypothetical protein